MNLVAEASENLYIFQPGGYFVRANTSAAGMFVAGTAMEKLKILETSKVKVWLMLLAVSC